MMTDTKCARCQKKILYFTAVLWMGPRGFRRYRMCDGCKKKTDREAMDADRKKIVRSVPDASV